MNNDARIEIANRLIAAMAAHPSKEAGKLWAKGSIVRVYTRKGFAEITEDGSVNIRSVGGHAFQAAIGMRVAEAGLTVA